MRRRQLIVAAPAALALFSTPAVRAQAFPGKPIRYIVPVSAGGGSDLVGRTVTDRWGKAFEGIITTIVDAHGKLITADEI